MNSEEVEIILVEDNEDDANLTKRAFKNQNLQNKILHLKNGEEAIEYFFEHKKINGALFTHNPKLILLDLNMPKVGGYEVLKRLKSDSKMKSIPVVILTSSAEDPDIENCYEIGANSYVVKPVEFETFIKTVVGLGSYWSTLNKTTS